VASLRIRTAVSLGLVSIIRVLWYRWRKSAGHFLKLTPVSAATDGPMFVSRATACYEGGATTPGEAFDLRAGRMYLFGLGPVRTGSPPEWHVNHLSGSGIDNPSLHWSEYGDFSTGVEDIKTVWELSRFSWAPVLARAYLTSGDRNYLDILNDWCDDWLRHNPYNCGPNWMCAQEAALRLAHVLLADALLRNEMSATKLLEEFVTRHCERIVPTISYAIGQQNNHATSEAFALFVGGAWLTSNASEPANIQNGESWHREGRRLLEAQVDRLVMADGTFAQMSMTYQRLFLDTISMAEWWRGKLGREALSARFHAKAVLATRWLHRVTDSVTGDCPNIGSHDGSALFPLSKARHRDCRPSVQLAGALFLRKRMFSGTGEWIEALGWLGVELPAEAEDELKSHICPDGGFCVLRPRAADSWLVSRFPPRKFRPPQSDALHIDIWVGNENLLRDGGSFSYASDEWGVGYFAGTASHNTCQFDDRDQMPRLGRFLYGAWLRTKGLRFNGDPQHPSWAAGYKDYRGCRHRRSVSYEADAWVIVDDIDGGEEKAVLRWRVAPNYKWTAKDNGIDSDLASITCSSESRIARMELSEGWESRFYMQRTALPVLEVEFGPGRHRVVTRIALRSNSL